MPQASTTDRTSRLLDLVRQFQLQDLLTTRLHSADFCFYRSDYLLVRIKLFALLFGIATPLWVPVDLWLLPAETLAPMAALRAMTGVLFLGLALFGTSQRSVMRARLALVALIAIPAFFYFASRLMLGPEEMEGAMVGYTFLPFVLLAGGALFPLTLLEGAAILSVVYVAVLATQVLFGQLVSLTALGTLWLMLLLSGIALWAQSAQLHMLLSLYRQATLDPLTGLFNRRAFFTQAQRELARADRNQQALAVLLLDLDRFKRINDRYGHPVGDQALRHLAAILKDETRDEDLLGRYGGEEFLIVAPNAGAEGAHALAERIRNRVAGERADTEEGPLSLTVSAGIALRDDGEPLEELVARADNALLQAKEAGRNRTIGDPVDTQPASAIA
ncbi:MAG TPA: GGDEF domain-containing protein [Gammaproteobacteria bacterium]|nr:GGDEF domain-containing protein [Gammaproteobacteria bacterium]